MKKSAVAIVSGAKVTIGDTKGIAKEASDVAIVARAFVCNGTIAAVLLATRTGRRFLHVIIMLASRSREKKKCRAGDEKKERRRARRANSERKT